MTSDYGSDDFRASVTVLRGRLGAHIRETGGFGGTAPVRQELEALVRDPTVDALLHLYDHLLYHEQFRAAILLLAHCTPALVVNDARVLDATRSALAKAERFTDPEAEVAAVRLERVLSCHQDQAHLLGMTQRAKFWMAVSRLVGAKVSLEFGCDHGLHVLAAAQIVPSVQWVGVDPRPEAVAVHTARAAGLRLTNTRFFELGAPETAKAAECVGLLEVLEHTMHPDVLLGKVEACCAPGGIVVVTIPHDAWVLHDGYGHGVDDGPTVGSHVAARHAFQLAAKLGERGEVLYVQTLDGFDEEDLRQTGCRTACVVYRPKRA